MTTSPETRSTTTVGHGISWGLSRRPRYFSSSEALNPSGPDDAATDVDGVAHRSDRGVRGERSGSGREVAHLWIRPAGRGVAGGQCETDGNHMSTRPILTSMVSARPQAAGVTSSPEPQLIATTNSRISLSVSGLDRTSRSGSRGRPAVDPRTGPMASPSMITPKRATCTPTARTSTGLGPFDMASPPAPTADASPLAGDLPDIIEPATVQHPGALRKHAPSRWTARISTARMGLGPLGTFHR